MGKPSKGKRTLESVEAAPEVSQNGQQQRFHAILTGLQESGLVAVDVLSEHLRVSVVTIRRDLDLLEQQGLLRRT
ncbi:MAG: DeoR family transcriptional regulator, partial [Acidobacteriaceae bacterium]